MKPLMRGMVTALLAVSFVGVTGCPIMWTQKDVIEARIIDARSGRPVAGALIQGKGLIEANGGQPVKTDQQGRFSLTSTRHEYQPGGFFMEDPRPYKLPCRLNVRAPGYDTKVVDVGAFEHERNSSQRGGQGTHLHRARGVIRLDSAAEPGEGRALQAYSEDELIRAIRNICWSFPDGEGFYPHGYLDSKTEAVSLIRAFPDDNETARLAEFFVHPVFWSRDRKATEYAAQIQGLILAMEARPGGSANVWNEFRRKVAARWSGPGDPEQPKVVQEVDRFYGSLSGALRPRKGAEE